MNQIGDPSLPPGRFVAGRTVTRLGEVNVIGVCIPWSHAHVNMGRRDRKPWDKHHSYLNGLAEVLSGHDRAAPMILLGDFNQTIPRSRAPARVYEALRSTLPSEMIIATDGVIPDVGAQSIDHLVHTPDLVCARVTGLSKRTNDGSRLSDHFGLVVELEPSSRQGSIADPSATLRAR